MCVGGGGYTYKIDDDVEVIATPGHTPECVSLIVRNSQLGTVVLSGKISFYPSCLCVGGGGGEGDGHPV